MIIEGRANDDPYMNRYLLKLKMNSVFFNNRIPKPQDNFVTLTSMFAVSSGSIGVDLQQIPNEPFRFIVRLISLFFQSIVMIYYQADPTNRSRGEDAAIAWTWKTFIENPDNPYVLLRMPMTKVENNTS